MPTPLKHSQNMTKHLTKAEKAARQAAECMLEPGKRAYMRAPAWLSIEARHIFQTTARRLRGFKLLEAVDIDLLANYADALARYQSAVRVLTEESDVKEIQAAQAWSRIALAYADKLGFSQTARTRLARRKAERAPADPMEQLLGEVNDFVNGDA